MPDSAMIFAAGFGTRLGALTATRPKPMVTLAGKPMINHSVLLAQRAGISKIAANLHYKHAILARHLASLGVAQSLELPEILDTGGGLRKALPLLSAGPVFTLNPDVAWKGPNPLTLLASRWNPTKMAALLMLIPREKALGHAGKGDFVMDGKARLSRGNGLVYSGVQIVKTDLLHTIADTVFSLNRLWDLMLENNQLYGLAYPGTWCDAGTPEGIGMAEKMLGQGDV